VLWAGLLLAIFTAAVSNVPSAMAQGCGTAYANPIECTGNALRKSPAAAVAPAAAPARSQGGLVQGPLGGYPAIPGKYVCAQYDKKNQRCLVRDSTEQEREQAYQTGVEAGMNGLQIQNEINRRLGMPAAPFPASAVAGTAALARGPQGVPGSTGSPGTTLDPSNPDTCVARARDHIAVVTGRPATTSDLRTILTLCTPG
jgi:hypothetical protein